MTNPLVPIRDQFAGPRLLSTPWMLTKANRTATCEAWSHVLGFELRLVITGEDLPRTHVCKSDQELTGIQEQWRAVLTGKGWS